MKFDTIAVHFGYVPDSDTKCATPPINLSTAYTFDSAEHARKLFTLEENGNIYSRLMNPTNDILEKRVAALDGGTAGLAFSSGHAAICATVLALASSGDEIISSVKIYGGALNLFSKSFARLGIKTHFVDVDEYDKIESLINDKTKMLFAESIGNPNADVIDIEKWSKIAKKHGIPLVIDNTFATPALLRPIEYGADIVIYSGTKYLCGHGNAMIGVVVDSGNFKFKDNPRFPDYNEPDESYHGIVYTDDCGRNAFITKLRVQILRDFGSCASPFNSYLTLLGVETLSLRMKKHSDNALAVAKYLENHKNVASVNYPAISSNKYYDLAKRYLPNGASSVFTFELKGSKEDGTKFIENLKLFSHVANVGDTRSIVTHPASTTHSQLSDEDLKASGITATTIRLSVGLEDIDDIIADLDSALNF